MGAVAKHIFLVTDPAKLEATVRTAFEIARTGRPGPVVVDVPKDVQNWECEFAGAGMLPIPGYRSRMVQLAAEQRVYWRNYPAAFFTFLLPILVLVFVGWIVVKLIIGIVAGLFWFILACIAVIAPVMYVLLKAKVFGEIRDE